MITDEEIRIVANSVIHAVESAPTPFWERASMMALVREIERLRREPAQTPALTFWLGANAPCAP